MLGGSVEYSAARVGYKRDEELAVKIDLETFLATTMVIATAAATPACNKKDKEEAEAKANEAEEKRLEAEAKAREAEAKAKEAEAKAKEAEARAKEAEAKLAGDAGGGAAGGGGDGGDDSAGGGGGGGGQPGPAVETPNW